MADNRNGVIGEEYTEKYLKKQGYEILEKNYHSRFGEIDIIAKNDKYIIFVEVKTRDEKHLYHPFQAVTKSKQSKIILTAQLYLQKKRTNLQPRFDVAGVICKNNTVVKIDYIPNAFY